jgi:predicted nucleic acid-binding protein
MTTDTGVEGLSLLLDSSAAIALLVEDHEANSAAVTAASGHRLGMAGHSWFETFSVLTRLPAGQRRSPASVLELLTRNFPASVFLGESEAIELGPELARLGITGGAVYDALVAAAARQHGVPLLSADRRARTTYEALGSTVVWVQ